jgi:hypothetical protein
MHQEHLKQIQQQGLQDPAALASDSTSSSSSSSRVGMAVQQKQNQVRADLLPIPAFHQDMATLLIGGRGYLQTAADAFASVDGTEQDRLHLVRTAATECMTAMQYSLAQIIRCAALDDCSAALDSCVALLSPPGVKLMLQLQLLAAGRVQRQQRLLRAQRTRQRQQQQQQDDDDEEGEGEQEEDIDPRELNGGSQASLLVRSSAVLSMQIKTALCDGSSCLPPEVLQQAGLQLLQALAAPMQQRLLSKSGPYAEVFDELLDGPSHRLYSTLLYTPYTLRAAACGLSPASGECCR